MGETPDRNTPPLRADGSYRLRRGPDWGRILTGVVLLVVFVGIGFVASRCGDQAPASDAFPAQTSSSKTASSTQATDPSDMAFLTILQQRGVEYGDQRDAIEAAHSTCEFLAGGGTQAQAGLLAMQYGQYSAADAGTIVGAATGAYCPQYDGSATR